MSDSKGRPTAADIPDITFLRALGKVEGFPKKVLQAKARKLAERGLLEITCDAHPRWLTDKGAEMLLADSKPKEAA